MCTAAPPPLNADGVPVDENGQPLSKNALKKLLKAQAVAAKKAEKAAAKAASGDAGDAGSSGVEGGATAAEEPPAAYSFGELVVNSATVDTGRVYRKVGELGSPGGPGVGDEVWVRGRLYRLRAKGNQCFLVLRASGQYTVQGTFFKDKETPAQSKEMLRWLGDLTEESIVDVRGVLKEATVYGCSQDNVEIAMTEVRRTAAAWALGVGPEAYARRVGPEVWPRSDGGHRGRLAAAASGAPVSARERP